MDLDQVRGVGCAPGYPHSGVHYVGTTCDYESEVISFAPHPNPEDCPDSLRKLVKGVTVYCKSGTVVVCIRHPTQGDTQLVRQNVSLEQLAEIMTNPQQHAGVESHTLSEDLSISSDPAAYETVRDSSLPVDF